MLNIALNNTIDYQSIVKCYKGKQLKLMYYK